MGNILSRHPKTPQSQPPPSSSLSSSSSPSQRFQIKPIDPTTDIPPLTRAIWDAFENPYQGIVHLFYPLLNNDRETSIQAAIENIAEEYRTSQPQLTWVKVIDTYHDDLIVAAAKWFFYEENPHAHVHEGDGEGIVADWFPEGVQRDFATQAVRLFEGPREGMARGPHAFLNIAFTLPPYRRQGLATLFMDWGLQRADERGLEAWLDASEFGAPLYEKYGFRKIGVNPVRPVPGRELSEEEKEVWEQCERDLLPIDYTVMWRPVKGVFVDGETKVPVMGKDGGF
ncbi:putative GNAT family acetyltransferase [Aspergillus stella-maris]|uniref:putative GNAT family acetyltransferase n=1 Tax=Aspergillus stella-maris TaxID=1810926 RepID=UPI003CCC9C1A